MLLLKWGGHKENWALSIYPGHLSLSLSACDGFITSSLNANTIEIAGAALEEVIATGDEQTDLEMNMVIAMAYLVVEIPESHSLKEKRSAVRPVIKRVQSRFNVSIAEIDNLESWQVAGVGIVCVSNARRHAEEMLQNVISFIEENLSEGYLAEVETDTQTF